MPVASETDGLEKQMLNTIDELQHWILRPTERSKRYTQDLLDKLKTDTKILAEQARSSAASLVSPGRPSNRKPLAPTEPLQSPRESEEYHARKSSEISAQDLKNAFGFSDTKWKDAKVDPAIHKLNPGRLMSKKRLKNFWTRERHPQSKIRNK